MIGSLAPSKQEGGQTGKGMVELPHEETLGADEMLKCILFDLDNTLLLKKPTIPEQVFDLVICEHPETRLEDVEKAYAASELWQGQQIQKENETGQRMSDEEYLQNVFDVYRQSLPLEKGDMEDFFLIFTGNHSKSYELMPGALDILPFLKAQELKLGVVSNNHSKVRQVLNDLKIAAFFDCIVISEEVNPFKTNPKILEYACEMVGVSCEDSLYVGDHPFDVLCAHKASMPAVWFPPNKFFTIPESIDKPEYTVRSLDELKTVLLS